MWCWDINCLFCLFSTKTVTFNNKKSYVSTKEVLCGNYKEIYQVCREMVKLEDKFLDLVFEMGDIQGLSKHEMKQYMKTKQRPTSYV